MYMPKKNSNILKPLIISLGIDCGPKIIIEKAKLSQETFPFDWCITYKGVSNIIENGYKHLLNDPIPSIDDGSYYDVENGIKFKHDGICCHKKECKFDYIQYKNKEKTLDEVKDKYIRRLDRLKQYLEAYNTSINNQQILFVRKSHDELHHKDASHYGIVIKNDIDDSIELEKFLSKEYPTLNYLIVVFLICKECYDFDSNHHKDANKLLSTNSSKIILHYIKKPKIPKTPKIYKRMDMNDYKIVQAHLRTNPKMFDKKLYCYTDKIKKNIKIIPSTCSDLKNKIKSYKKNKKSYKLTKLTKKK